jgi:hypothetical protein
VLVLAGLLSVAVFCLAVPLEAVLRLDIHGRPRLLMRLSWFFGLISRELSKEHPPAEDITPASKTAGKKHLSIRSMITFLRILKTKGLTRQLFKLVRDIVRLPRWQYLLADFQVGLGDPADTGLLFAVIGPATALFQSTFPGHLRLEPDFTDKVVLDGYVSAKVRLLPIRLTPPVLRFTCSAAAIRAAWQMVVEKWKQRS